jgi:hypothetical protein
MDGAALVRVHQVAAVGRLARAGVAADRLVRQPRATTDANRAISRTAARFDPVGAIDGALDAYPERAVAAGVGTVLSAGCAPLRGSVAGDVAVRTCAPDGQENPDQDGQCAQQPGHR